MGAIIMTPADGPAAGAGAMGDGDASMPEPPPGPPYIMPLAAAGGIAVGIGPTEPVEAGASRMPPPVGIGPIEPVDAGAMRMPELLPPDVDGDTGVPYPPEERGWMGETMQQNHGRKPVTVHILWKTTRVTLGLTGQADGSTVVTTGTYAAVGVTAPVVSPAVLVPECWRAARSTSASTAPSTPQRLPHAGGHPA